MSYGSRLVTIVWLITFGLFALAGFGVVAGVNLVWPIAAALATPFLVLRDPAEETARTKEPWLPSDISGAIRQHAPV